MANRNICDFNDPVVVANGGTGVASNSVPYGVLCAGTTSTAALQNIASVGTSGQVLTSNGAGALPTFQTNTVGGAFVFLSQYTPAAASSQNITLSGYNNYYISYYNISVSNTAINFVIEVSDDNGATWKNAGYNSGDSLRWNAGGIVNYAYNTYVALNGASDTDVSSGGLLSGNVYINNVGVGTGAIFQGQGYWYSVASTNYEKFIFGCMSPPALTITTIRFRPTAGTFSGTINFYGIKTA